MCCGGGWHIECDDESIERDGRSRSLRRRKIFEARIDHRFRAPHTGRRWFLEGGSVGAPLRNWNGNDGDWLERIPTYSTCTD